MENKKGKINSGAFVTWGLYGLLMVGTILIFVFWKEIYGVSHVDPLTNMLIWDYTPFFARVVSDNPF